MSVVLTGLVVLETGPDPSVVQPGIIPLIMLIVLVGVCVLLYRSMRNQLRKLDRNDLPHEQKAPEPGSGPDIDIRHPAP